jgi:Holliday junction DNA helicase RuvA
MICSLSGTITHHSDGFDYLEVHGIGYEVILPSVIGRKLHGTQTLYTHEVIRDSERELFGFTNREALELARRLLDVPGVGPRLAQRSVYGGTSVAEVIEKIEGGDVGFCPASLASGKRRRKKSFLS